MSNTVPKKSKSNGTAKGVLTINPQSQYHVRYLGWCYADSASGHGCTKPPVIKIVKENQMEESKMDKIVISITKYGLDVEFLEGAKSEYIYRFDIRYISYCSVNTEIGPRIFAWLYKKPQTSLICHAVICGSKGETRNMAMDLYAAFHVAYEEFRHKFGPKDSLPQNSERTVSTQTSFPTMRTRSLERAGKDVQYEERKLTQRCERNALREFHARSDYYPSPADSRRGINNTDSETASRDSVHNDAREIIRFCPDNPGQPERVYIQNDVDDSYVSPDEDEEKDADVDVTKAPKTTVIVDPRDFNHGLGPDNDETGVADDDNSEPVHVKDRVEIDTDDDTSIEGENMYVVAAQVETIQEDDEGEEKEQKNETENDEVKENSVEEEEEMVKVVTVNEQNEAPPSQEEDRPTSPAESEIFKTETVRPLLVPVPMQSCWIEMVNGETDHKSETKSVKSAKSGTKSRSGTISKSDTKSVRSKKKDKSVKESGIETEQKDDNSSELGDRLKLPVETSEEKVSRYVQNSPQGKVAYDPFAPMNEEELFGEEIIDVQIWQQQ